MTITIIRTPKAPRRIRRHRKLHMLPYRHTDSIIHTIIKRLINHPPAPVNLFLEPLKIILRNFSLFFHLHGRFIFSGAYLICETDR